MSLLTALITRPPRVPVVTRSLRTHELRQGSEIVARNGISTVVSEIDHATGTATGPAAVGKRIRVQCTNGDTAHYRRNRRWRVIAPAGEVLVPFLPA